MKKPPEVELYAQLLHFQHLAVLAVFYHQVVNLEILSKEADADMANLNMGVQVVL